MRVLFFMRSTVYVRNFESTLRLLAERGHDVHVAADAYRKLDPTDLIGRLCREHPRITYSAAPPPRATRWARIGIELRSALDYLRYLEPEYRDAPKLRRRAEQKAPAFVRSALRQPFVDTPIGRSMLRRAIQGCDRAVPRDPAIDDFVRQHRPDLVLVTPLVEPGSPQSAYVRSARALGIPTGLCVYSWDNLTNKGLIHESLDVVTVWNEPMKQEAVGLHGIPADRVVVTGAAAYDHWFAWRPSSTREAFCARVGLDPAQPYILYLCSSRFIAPDESPFVRRWVQEIRAASPALRHVGVLVRPHPQSADEWRNADLSDLGAVVVWPREGGNPVDVESRASYYDSIHHSAAVVGVNTSAQIESAIVGRGVYTVLGPEFRETQEGTLHFRHLREVNGGLLHVASDMADHAAQLVAAVHDPEQGSERGQRFVAAFVRPHGPLESATPRLVATLEAVAARGATDPVRDRWWMAAVRPALSRAFEKLDGPGEASPERVPESKRKEKRQQRLEATARQKAAAEAYAHYLDLRESMRVLRESAAGGADDATPAERQMLAAFAPLWDAQPETIAELRHVSKVITGVRRSDYAGSKATATQTRLEPELARLLERGDRGLWIEEPIALGGFGFVDAGKRYNEDTLRFFRVLSLLDDAALLKDFRGPERRTVWEIGGGWGGFAFQFKTVCPEATYLITAPPDLLLVSAVYLRTLFPSSRFRVYDPTRPGSFWRDWHEVDFAFAPENVVPDLQPRSLDLVVDLMALERMSPARIALHVTRAHALGCRYFFSMCPPVAVDSTSSVRTAIEGRYWPHPVSAPLYLAKRLALTAGSRASESTYLLGWRRLCA